MPNLLSRPGDPRIWQLIGSRSVAKVALLGFPSDLGAERNLGRVGSRRGPTAFREQFYRLAPDARDYDRFVAVLGALTDLGDVACSGALESDLAALSEIVANLVRNGVFPIIIGGSHDLTLAHWRAYKIANRPVSIINMDAHPDVREVEQGRTNSGTPFREILEDSSASCSGYLVWGLAPWSTSKESLDFLRRKNCQAFMAGEVSQQALVELYEKRTQPTLATFDLDALPQAVMPGVSAPNGGGVGLQEFFQACQLVGANDKFSSVDFVELNPEYDRDSQSARVAALGVWHVLKGLCYRGSI